MKKIIYLFFVTVSMYFVACKNETMPRPEEGEENEETRLKFFELRHRAAPGVNWKSIEKENTNLLTQQKNNLLFASVESTSETFANGKLTGIWKERGSNNIAGNVKAIAYDADAAALYCVSDGGTLWKGKTDGSSWLILNQNIRCQADILKLVNNGIAGKRILVSFNSNIQYSDNDGALFTPSTGIEFPVEWGGNYIAGLFTLKDAEESVYCLTRPWDPTPWSPRFWLYRSTDKGKTFSKIYTFDFGGDNAVTLTQPVNTNNLLAFEASSTPGKGSLYTITGDNIAKTSTATLSATNQPCILRGFQKDAQLTLYILINNKDVYRSLDNGATWLKRGILPESSWNMFEISNIDPNRIFAGGVEAYRSVNGGTNWSKINNWYDYYGNEATKLHADIMEIEAFRKKDNTPFLITCTHGGAYISYNDQISNNNISLTGHNTGQFYDVLTDQDNTNNIYGGTQDQGFQRNTAADGTEDVLDFIQVISGDYGYLTFSNGTAKHLWTEYPYGDITYYNDPNGFGVAGWKMNGTNLPNYGWLLPIENAYTNQNEIYMGGGNTSGGTGSFLVKIKVPEKPPYTITTSQFPYNFRLNSNTKNANISSLAVDKNDSNRIYVAAEDGTFFYSKNKGVSWLRTPAFDAAGGWWLYGSDILVSTKTTDKIWYAGSGYSNPPVYESVDGGATFSDMSQGLPPTLVYELAANPDESLLFAATEAGPYVYVVQDKLWHPIIGQFAPVQSYTTVEYIASKNIVRFGTYGRGIWDFTIEKALPASFTNFSGSVINGDIQLQWLTANEINNSYFEIESSTNGRSFIVKGKINAASNSANANTYRFTDHKPAKGLHYYRIKQSDKNGSYSYSKTIKLEINTDTGTLIVAPNPVKDICIVTLPNEMPGAILFLYDAQGRIVKRQAVQGLQQTLLLTGFAPGNYRLVIADNKKQLSTAVLKR